jgi:hypothetical protein
VQLGEQRAVRIDRQGSGFELTLVEGEVVAYTDQLIDTGDDLTFTGVNMAMGVRGSLELFDGLLTLNSELAELAPSMAGFTGWEEYTWGNYHYAGEWREGMPLGEGTVSVALADGTMTLTGKLEDGFFNGTTTRTIELNSGVILNDVLELKMGRVSDSSRQVYGMQPWIGGEAP